MNDVVLWIDDIWREGAAPEPPLTVSQWADEHRMLPDLSAEPGRWRTSRTPYLRDIMDCLSANDPTERVVFVKGAQLGGTEAGLNFLGPSHSAPRSSLCSDGSFRFSPARSSPGSCRSSGEINKCSGRGFNGPYIPVRDIALPYRGQPAVQFAARFSFEPCPNDPRACCRPQRVAVEPRTPVSALRRRHLRRTTGLVWPRRPQQGWRIAGLEWWGISFLQSRSGHLLNVTRHFMTAA
jgi:hypothetical protein